VSGRALIFEQLRLMNLPNLGAYGTQSTAESLIGGRKGAQPRHSILIAPTVW
jgi:hypothetical protein